MRPLFLLTAFLALTVFTRPLAAAGVFQPGVDPIADSGPLFDRPHDLVLSPDGKYLLVADTGHDMMQILDPATLKVIGTLGKGELAAPRDAAFLDDHTVLVADTGHDRIAVYDFHGVQDGKTAARLTASWSDHMKAPDGIAVAPDGGAVYVANGDSDAVVRLTPSGVLENGIGGLHPRDMVNFSEPHAVVVDKAGRVIVADTGDDRLVVLNPELIFLGVYKGAPFDFDDPMYMAADAEGGLWLADSDNDRILHLNAFMTVDRIIGADVGPKELDGPEGVAVSGNRIWISDTGNDRVILLRYRP